MAGPSTFAPRGPCHCCQEATAYQAIAVAIPQRAIDYVNGIIAGYPASCPNLTDFPLDYPTDDDARSAMRIAYAAVMAVDMLNPPVDWTPARELGSLAGPTAAFPNVHSFKLRQINAFPTQNPSGPNGGTSGLIFNPVFAGGVWEGALSPWQAVLGDFALTFRHAEPRLDVDFAGMFSGVELDGWSRNSPNSASFGICDYNGLGAGGLVYTGPLALASRTRIVGRDHLCLSTRRIKEHESSIYIGECGTLATDPVAGWTVNPFNPDGTEHVFDLTGMVYDDARFWSEGRCIWIDETNQDCLCNP